MVFPRNLGFRTKSRRRSTWLEAFTFSTEVTHPRESIIGNTTTSHQKASPDYASAIALGSDTVTGSWEERLLRPVGGSQRGCLAVGIDNGIFFILPDAATKTMSLMRATAEQSYRDYATVWEGSGLSGEPLVDTSRLNEDGTLSIYTLQDSDSAETKNVVVIDFRGP